MTFGTASILTVVAAGWIGAMALALIEWRRAGSPAARRAGRWSRALAAVGIAALGTYIVATWIGLGRPPMRTLGETRLWYAFFVPVIGLAVERRLRLAAARVPGLLMGLVFVVLGLARPDAFDRTMMPALQSPWFVPHVIVYMAGYAVMGLAAAIAVWELGRASRRREPVSGTAVCASLRLVRVGVPLLTIGMAFGAVWAQIAWGDYWTWDPKETWAFISWTLYLLILHADARGHTRPRRMLVLVALAAVGIIATWFLVNVLPSAAASVHTYTR
jgi:ABC-type transport system involved in cytochrome c biogenesis permease subunit